MRFFQTLLSGAAFLAAATALTIDSYPQSVVAGQTYTITYSPKDQTPTTFILRQGPSTNLNTVETLTTDAKGGSFSWTPSKSLTNHQDYALQIQQGNVINYSGQFPITGGTGTGASSSAAASASASAASSASASKSSAMSASHSASASIVPSVGTNSTVSSATLSRSSTASATSRPSNTNTASGPPQSTGAASSLATSPLAAIFGAFAAFAYLA